MESVREVFEKRFVPVGATFLVNDVEYVVQEGFFCYDCDCSDFNGICTDCDGVPRFPMCLSLYREDGKEVVFKKVR